MSIESEQIHRAAIELRPVIERAKSQKDFGDMLTSRDQVLARFQPIFSLEHVPQLTEEEFRSFLLFKNNRHWSGLHRLGTQITSDMVLLRDALMILLDEKRPIEERLDTLLPKKGAMVKGLGRAFITPILMVIYPDKYGVMNNPSTEGARILNILPEFQSSMSFSKRYLAFNDVLHALAQELKVDLWALDGILGGIAFLRRQDDAESEIPTVEEDEILGATSQIGIESARFGLERYLQEFMRDNWDKIPELTDWMLYEEDGEITGYEFNTNTIGRIDLLARHKKDGKWLVIELKRNQGSDDTIGQVQRYMGWVAANLAKKGETVQGLIVSREKDQKLDYALMFAKNVEVMLYEVNFKLRYPMPN